MDEESRTPPNSMPSKEERVEARVAELERQATILLQDRLARLGRGGGEFYEQLVSSLQAPTVSPEVEEWAASLSADNQELLFNLAVQIGALRHIRKCLQRSDLLQALEDALWLIYPGNTTAAWIARRNLRGEKGKRRRVYPEKMQAEADSIWAEYPDFKKERVAKMLSEKHGIKPSTIERNIRKRHIRRKTRKPKTRKPKDLRST